LPTDFSKLVKTIGAGRGHILAPHIDMFLEQHNEFAPTVTVGGIKVDDGHFHPSGHCLMDEEALYQDRLGAQHRSITAAQKKTFDCGHMWHGYIQAALVEMGFVKPENVERHITLGLPAFNEPFPFRTKISGTVDLFDVEIPGRGSWLVDIKTASIGTFANLEQTSLFEKYKAQVNVYGDMVKQKNILILVIQKDSPHDFREIQIQSDPELLSEIYEKWIRVARRLEENESIGF